MLNSHIFREKIPHFIGSPLGTLQISFCKYILGVGKAACNEAVLGEVGRLPMFVQYHKKCIKYWLKLIEMSTTRYVCML